MHTCRNLFVNKENEFDFGIANTFKLANILKVDIYIFPFIKKINAKFIIKVYFFLL